MISSIFVSKTRSSLAYFALVAIVTSFLFYIWFNSKQIVETAYKQHLISVLTSSVANLRSYENRYKLNGDLEQQAMLSNGTDEVKTNISKLSLSLTDSESQKILTDIEEFTDEYQRSFNQFVSADQSVISKAIKFRTHLKTIEQTAMQLSTENEETYLVQGENIEEYWSDFLSALDESKFIETQLNQIDTLSSRLNNQQLAAINQTQFVALSAALRDISDQQSSYKNNLETVINSETISSLGLRLNQTVADYDAVTTNSILNQLKTALKQRKSSIDKTGRSLRLRYYVTQDRQHRAKKITDYAYKLRIGISSINNLKSEFILQPDKENESRITDHLNHLLLATEDIQAEITNTASKASFNTIFQAINHYKQDFSELVNQVNLRVEADRSMVANLIKLRAFTTSIGPKITKKIYHQQDALSEFILSSVLAFALLLASLMIFIFWRKNQAKSYITQQN